MTTVNEQVMQASYDAWLEAQPRYTVHAYICGPACWKPSPFGPAAATFEQVLNHRPNDCRYAVVVDRLGEGLVWDLYDDSLVAGLQGENYHFEPPEPVRTGVDLDALVMATCMTYGEDEA